MSISEQIQALQTDKEDIATAIEDMGGTVNTGDGFDDFADDIRTIPTGAEIESNITLEKRQFYVRFISLYDEEVETWTIEEALNKTSLPTVPDVSDTDPNLTTNGWNWTLAQIKAYINSQTLYTDIYVGAQFLVSDNATHLFISIPYGGRLTVPLYLRCTSTGGMTIDWGDGTTQSNTSTSVTTYTHTYSASGDYEIKIKRTAGVIYLGNQSSSYNIFGSITDNTTTHARATSGLLRKVYVGVTGTSTLTNYAFYYCLRLETIVFGSTTITDTGACTFQNCYRPTYLYMNNSLKTIGNNCFNACYCFRYALIPHSVTTINYNAFYNGSSLREVCLPSSLTLLGNNVFSYCLSLESVTVPNSLYNSTYGAGIGNVYEGLPYKKEPWQKKNISTQTVTDREAMRTVMFKTNVDKVIDNDTSTTLKCAVYSENYNLKDITFKNNITTFGYGCFAYCVNLNYNIPSTVTKLVEYHCIYNMQNLDVVIPKTVTSVGYCSFQANRRLRSCTWNSTSTVIGSNMWQHCYSFTNCPIPNNCTSLGYACMQNCYSMQTITVPNTVTETGTNLFQSEWCLQYVKWSSSASVTSNTFNGCYGVKTYDFTDCTAVPTLGSGSNNSAISVGSDTVIVVPDSLYSSWIAATNWKNFASYIKKASEVTLV